MKPLPNTKSLFVDIACWLYILLWIYAATSKILDFENFQIQIGQSPLISAFAGWVAWAVPIAELVLALCLTYPPLKLYGLFSSYFLIIMFSAYIYIALHYSSFVPCSCGGILEKMSWDDHLVFNLAFAFVAAAAILLYKQVPDFKRQLP